MLRGLQLDLINASFYNLLQAWLCHDFRFMESEVELNDIIQELHVIATVPYLYHILVDLNAIPSLLQLLNHENTGSYQTVSVGLWIFHFHFDSLNS